MNTVNLEAEKSVLGAILIDPSKLKKVRDIISWKDFSDSTNQWVFRCMEWLDKQDIEVDIITLTDAMKKAGVYETIGSAYPLELTEYTPTSARVLDYAKIVKSCSDARKMGDIVSQASHIASEGGDIDEAVKKIKEKLNEVNNLGGKSNKYQVVSMAEFSEEAKARFDNWGKLQGISTGFPSLDSLTLGLVGGELIIIAGATSRGKSLLAMSIANNVAKRGKRVLFVTLEMTHAELTSRYMYINGGADSRDYKTVALNTIFQQNDELDWKDIDGLIKNAKERLDVDLVIIDHLHYFSRDTVNTSEDLGRITKEFKKNAIRYNIPIILISHIRKMAKDEQLSGESLRGCLPFDEKVTTDRGEIPIKDIKAGDKIISTTEDLKKTIEPVTAKWETGSKLIYRITLEDGRSIRVSGSHRILTLFGYTRAENLFAGDYVFVHKSPKVNKRRSGLTELKVTRVEALEEMLTCDLEIATTHNYAVNGVVTHNSSLIAQDSDIVLLVDRDPKTNEMGVMIDKNRNRGKLSDRTKDWNGQSDREVNTVFLEFNSTKLRDPKTLPEGISELFPGAKVVPITNKEKE